MNVFTAPRAWLIAVAGTYGIVFLGYGHAGLPLGVALPYVWANMRDADMAIAIVAAVGAVGVIATMVSFFADLEQRLWRMCGWGAILAFSVSACVAIAISDIATVTAVSAVPMAGSAIALAGRMMRLSTTETAKQDAG